MRMRRSCQHTAAVRRGSNRRLQCDADAAEEPADAAGVATPHWSSGTLTLVGATLLVGGAHELGKRDDERRRKQEQAELEATMRMLFGADEDDDDLPSGAIHTRRRVRNPHGPIEGAVAPLMECNEDDAGWLDPATNWLQDEMHRRRGDGPARELVFSTPGAIANLGGAWERGHRGMALLADFSQETTVPFDTVAPLATAAIKASRPSNDDALVIARPGAQTESLDPCLAELRTRVQPTTLAEPKPVAARQVPVDHQHRQHRRIPADDGKDYSRPDFIKRSVTVSLMLLDVLLLHQGISSSRRSGVSPHADPTATKATGGTDFPSVSERRLQTKSIQDVPVGERIVGRNPMREQAELVEPDPATWSKICLYLEKDMGLGLWIELLRPLTWIERQQAKPGNAAYPGAQLRANGAVSPASWSMNAKHGTNITRSVFVNLMNGRCRICP